MRRVPLPTSVDALIAAALFAVGQYEAWTVTVQVPRPVHAVVAAVVTASLAWRRQFPLGVLVVTIAGIGGTGGDQFSLFAAVVIGAYTCGAELDPPRSWIGLALSVLPFWVAFAFEDSQPSDFVAPVVLYGGAWMAGRLVHERGRRADALAERAIVLERERDERAAVAAAEERARIARELHDVVSHSISAMALQSQAIGRRLRPDQQREADELEALSATAREAMGEMRRLFGVLRADGESLALRPQPGLGQLASLVDETRSLGVPVDLELDGDASRLPPGVDLAAFRIVQEALTNVRKHAGGAPARVRVRVGEREIEVLVEDDGAGRANGDGIGHGLVGMRERAALYGGTLETGRAASGGFRVRATLAVPEDGPA